MTEKTDKLIFNFSHPLGDQAKADIRQDIGPFTVANVRVQLDLNSPVGEQVFKLCRAAVELHGKPDYIIPPGLALAAVYVGRFFTTIEGFPPHVTYVPIIRLVALAGPVTAYAFGGIEE